MKNCRRFLDKADKCYEAIPESYRNREDVISIHKDYTAILEKSGHSKNSNQAAVASAASVDEDETYGLDSKALRKSRQYASRFDKKMAEAQRFYDENDMYICEKRLIDADKLYTKIGEAYQQDPGVRENKKRYDEMHAEVSQKIAARKKAIENKTELLYAGSSFSSEVRKLSSPLALLAGGKANKTAVSLFELERRMDSVNSLDEFYNKCKGKYASVLEQTPDKEYEGMTVKEIYELVENRVAYRDNIVKATAMKELDALIGGIKKTNNKILETNTIASSSMAKLKSDDFLSEFVDVEKTRILYKWIKAPEPSDKMNAIASLQQEQKKSIDKVRKKLKFKKSEYSYKTSAMKSAAERNAKERKMDLVYVGMKEDRWGITKNGLGIPLYKSATGRALYHVDGEKFYRGYDVIITKHFNGNGYDPISTVKPKSPVIITIYKK